MCPEAPPPPVQPARVLKGHAARVCAVAAAGAVVVTGCADGAVSVWDAATGAFVRSLRAHRDCVYGASVSADGAFAATAGGDGCVRVSDVPSGSALAVLRRGRAKSYGAALSEGGERVVAGFWSSDVCGEVVVYDWRPRRVVRSWEVGAGVFAVAVSRDGGVVACAWDNGIRAGVDVFDVESGRRMRSIPAVAESFVGVAVDEVGARVLVCDDAQLRVVTVRGDRPPVVLESADVTLGSDKFCAATPDFSHVVVSGDNNEYEVWDIAARAKVAVLEGHAAVAQGCAISGDGSRIFSASADMMAHVYHMDYDALRRAAEPSAASNGSADGHSDSGLDCALLNRLNVSEDASGAAALTQKVLFDTVGGLLDVWTARYTKGGKPEAALRAVLAARMITSLASDALDDAAAASADDGCERPAAEPGALDVEVMREALRSVASGEESGKSIVENFVSHAKQFIAGGSPARATK